MLPQRGCLEEEGGNGVVRRVAACLPTPLYWVTASHVVKAAEAGDDDTPFVLVIGEVVAQRSWVGVDVVGEGENDLVLPQLRQCRRAGVCIEQVYRRNP